MRSGTAIEAAAVPDWFYRLLDRWTTWFDRAEVDRRNRRYLALNKRAVVSRQRYEQATASYRAADRATRRGR